jgi:hypothetical protein
VLDVPGVRLLVEKAPTALTLQPIIMSLVGIDFWRRQITHSNAGREQCFVSAFNMARKLSLTAFHLAAFPARTPPALPPRGAVRAAFFCSAVIRCSLMFIGFRF